MLLASQHITPSCLLQVAYPQMAPIRLGVVLIFVVFLYLCQIISDLYETLNLNFGVTIYPPKVAFPKLLL